MKRIDTTVRSIRKVAEGYFELRFAWELPDNGDPVIGDPVIGDPAIGNPAIGAPSIGGHVNGGHAGDDSPAPGRFVTIRAGGRYDPALRRPFAFSDYSPDAREAAIVFQLRGRGTAFLADLKPGDPLDVLGPLGKGFGSPPRSTRPVLVAGGIGIGPMLYLASALAARADAGLGEAPTLAMGFRSAAYVPGLPLPPGAVVCTDDGSYGYEGTVADYLAGYDPGLPPAFYACGPAPMMAAVGRLAAARRAPYEAAVEQWMACGVGACAGCAVPLKSGAFVRACADGPVLDGDLVDWEASL